MTENNEPCRAYAQLKARVDEMLKDMTEEERNALRISFPFPDPTVDGKAGTAEASKERRRRRHPRRKQSLREFIESMEDSKPK